MPINITLNDIRIDDWAVNVEQRFVLINYKRLRNDGSVYDRGEAYFWETIPDPGTDPNGDPLPVPEDWYQLPPTHAAAIISLTQDARIALGQLVGEDLT